jgi:uncharacterized OB-fold protein
MDPYAEQFWAYTQKKELRLQKCSDCGKFRFPPGPTCDKCLSDEAEWAAVAGRGKVLSWTTFRRKYFEEYPAAHTRSFSSWTRDRSSFPTRSTSR